MRILHVYRTYFPDSQGGLEEVIRQICASTKSLNVESRVLSITSSAGAPVVERPEATVFRARQTVEIASCNISMAAFKVYPQLARWADVVHFHFPWPFADILKLCTRVNRPTVLTYHSDIVRQRFLSRIYAPLMHHFLASVDRIVCTSPNYLASSKVLSRYRNKVAIIPIGIDEQTYPTSTARDLESTRELYGSDFFLFVGVLRYYKGLHILLDAIRNAPYRVVIVGSGPTEAELKNQARRLNLHNVTLAGHLPDSTKVALFRLARAVVFPSFLRSEAFGVTLLEGAIYGKPLISTEIGSGTSHVNVHGETGLVVPPGSAEMLRAAMDSLSQNPEMAARLGRGARARYERLFTGSAMGRRYYELYQEVLAGHSANDSGISKVD